MLSETVPLTATRLRSRPPSAGRRSCIVAGYVALLVMLLLLLTQLRRQGQNLGQFGGAGDRLRAIALLTDIGGRLTAFHAAAGGGMAVFSSLIT